MKTKTKKLLILFAMFVVSLGYSQTNVVTGTVVSSLDGTVLPGVNVIVKGTTEGTTTDFDGKFSMNVSSDDTLLFSYVGFKTQEVSVGNKTLFSISLEEDASQLDEVVIVGYGTQKKANLTGSLSTVKTDDIKDRPITQASQMLSGQAAGVSVLQQSGKPGGDGATIRIRGVGTLGNSSPLIYLWFKSSKWCYFGYNKTGKSW